MRKKRMQDFQLVFMFVLFVLFMTRSYYVPKKTTVSLQVKVNIKGSVFTPDNNLIFLEIITLVYDDSQNIVFYELFAYQRSVLVALLGVYVESATLTTCPDKIVSKDVVNIQIAIILPFQAYYISGIVIF